MWYSKMPWINRSLKLHGSQHIRHNSNFAKDDKGKLQGFYTNHHFTSQLLEKAQDKVVNLSKKIELHTKTHNPIATEIKQQKQREC